MAVGCLSPIDPHGFEECIHLVDKGGAVLSIHCRRVVLVQEDAGMRQLFGELVTEPELAVGTSWSSPCVPGMLLVRFTPGVQPMNRDDTGVG